MLGSCSCTLIDLYEANCAIDPAILQTFLSGTLKQITRKSTKKYQQRTPKLEAANLSLADTADNAVV